MTNPASELAKKRWSKVSREDRIKEMKRIRAFGKKKVIHTPDIDVRTTQE